MTIWLLINTTIGLLVLLFLKLQDDAPHRLRFYCCAGAMGAWLVPWNLLPGLFPPALTAQLAVGFSPVPALLMAPALFDANSAEAGADIRQIAAAILAFTTFIGALLFVRALYLHASLLRRLEASSRELPDTAFPCGVLAQLQQRFRTLPPVRVQNILPGAIGTGIHNPTIWVNEALLDDEALEAVLHHELVHLRQHDNAWLCLLTLVECLLWWNPLLRFLSRHARQAQELSCDAQCLEDMPGYRSILGKLVIDLSEWQVTNRSTPQSLYSSIVKDANFNVERVRQLQRRLDMKPQHKLGAGLLIAGSLLVCSSPLVLSQDATPTERNERLREDIQEEATAAARRMKAEQEVRMAQIEAREGPTQTKREAYERMIRVGLELYATNMEVAYTELMEKNENLEARVQELEQQMAKPE